MVFQFYLVLLIPVLHGLQLKKVCSTAINHLPSSITKLIALLQEQQDDAKSPSLFADRITTQQIMINAFDCSLAEEIYCSRQQPRADRVQEPALAKEHPPPPPSPWPNKTRSLSCLPSSGQTNSSTNRTLYGPGFYYLILTGPIFCRWVAFGRHLGEKTLEGVKRPGTGGRRTTSIEKGSCTLWATEKWKSSSRTHERCIVLDFFLIYKKISDFFLEIWRFKNFQ